MKIAIIGSTRYDTMEYHLNESFIYNSHQSQVFDVPNGNTANIFSNIKIFMDIANEVDQYHPDLIIAVYRIIHPEFVILMKKKGYAIIQVNPDALTTFDLQQLFAAEYDVYFTKDPYIKRFMESNLKLNVKLYNEAFNKRVHVKPDIDKIKFEKEFDIDLMTYGSMYPYRNRMLRILADNCIGLTLFGNTNVPFYDQSLDEYHSGYHITGEAKAKILYGAKIVFNNLHYAEIESVNARFFEINGCGAFQLSDYRSVLKDLLPIDPELVSFRSIDEAVEKINYYLQHPEERVAIAQTIYNHFMEHYTYDHLTQYILESI
jgi:spore maturation protein CgeB